METVQEKQFNELRRHLTVLRDDCDRSKSALSRLRLDVEIRIDIIDNKMRVLGFKPPTDSKSDVSDVNDTANGTDEEISFEIASWLMGIPKHRRFKIFELACHRIDEFCVYTKTDNSQK